MNITFINHESNYPHLFIIRDNTTNNVELEFYCKPNSNTQTTVNLPNKVYSIELINPNLTNCIVRRTYIRWNPNTNQMESVGSDVNVGSGRNNVMIFDGVANAGIMLLTNNYRVDDNIISSIVGSEPISNTDLDGNLLSTNERIFSKLNFKYLDNSLSTFSIDNKKLRKTSPNCVIEDCSDRLPYLAKYTVSNTTTLSVPIISMYDGDILEWSNPPAPKSAIKNIIVHRNNQLFSQINTSTPVLLNSIFINDLVGGTYKIKYSLDNINFSDFSNEITLNPDKVGTPSITGVNSLNSSNTGTITLTGQPLADIYEYYNNLETKLVETVGSNGSIVLTVNKAGKFKYKLKIQGSVISDFSNEHTITPYNANCVAMSNIVIATKVGGETPNSKRTISVTFEGSQPSSFSWAITGQGTSIISGSNSLSPEFQFGNSNGKITFTATDCTGILRTKEYDFTLNNLITPIISKVNETTLKWANDSDTSLKTKTIRVYNSSGSLQQESINKSGSDNIVLSIAGSYKITYSFDGINFSADSNLITINPVKTVIPTFTSNPTNGQILSNGTEEVVFTFTNLVSGGTIIVFKNDEFFVNLLSGEFRTSQIGVYKFRMFKVGEVTSDFTNNFTVSHKSGSNPSCLNNDDFSINNFAYDSLTKTVSFIFNAANFINGSWIVKKNNVSIDTGLFQNLTSNNQSVVLTNYLTDGNYEFSMIGTSCTGVAVKNFAVTSVPIGCTLEDLEISHNENLVKVRFESSITTNLENNIYCDVYDSNSMIVKDNIKLNVTIVNDKYESIIDFIDVYSGNYLIKIKHITPIYNCSVQSNYNFNIIDTDITTGILQGSDEIDCDFSNFDSVQLSNSNTLEVVFDSGIVSNSFNVSIYSDDSLSELKLNIIGLEPISYDDFRYTLNINLNPINVSNTYYILIRDSQSSCNTGGYFIYNRYNTTTVTPVIVYNNVNNTISFTPTCSNGKVIIYVDDEQADEIDSGLVANQNFTISLQNLPNLSEVKIKLLCPLQLISGFSNTIIVTNSGTGTCTAITNPNNITIIGNSNISRNSNNNAYFIDTNLLVGTLPFTIETAVVGGTIVSGNNTSNILVSVTNSQQLIINFKVFNCDRTSFISINKTVTISGQVVNNPNNIIVSVSNRILFGITAPNQDVDIYNQDGELLVRDVMSDNNGAFKVRVPNTKAYYFLNNGNISNIFTKECSTPCDCNQM